MASRAEEIASLLQREGSGLSPDEYDETPESDEIKSRRVKVLSDVVSECRNLWSSGSEDLDVVAQKLADGSRDAAWRVPYGQSGMLSLFLEVIGSHSLRPALQFHTLRLIGNSCADTDENRARVIDGGHLKDIIRRLQDDTAIPLAIPVLYNVLVDYELAQIQASQAGLSTSLVELIASPKITDYAPFVSYICKILGLLITQDGEAERASPLTVRNLLSLCQQPEFRDEPSDFISLSAAASAYLASEPFQKRMVEDAGQLLLLLDTVQHANTALEVEEPDEAESVKSLRGSLHKILADVTGLDEFGRHHPLGTPVPETLLSWLRGGNTPLRSAACLALGNLSRSDETSTALVATYEAHVPLIGLLSDPATADAQSLHAAMSFLKNLGIPPANKPVLGPILDSQRMPRVFTLDTMPQVQYTAASLTRLLLVDCPDNVRRVCQRQRQRRTDDDHDEGTVVASLCSLLSRTDAEPTKMEAARAVATLCRVLHSNPVRAILPDWDDPDGDDEGDDDSKRRARFYSAHDLATPLSFLITQPKWPSLRSEAWFVLALMCRSRDGSHVVSKITADDEVANMLVKAITGRPASEVTPAIGDEEREKKAIEPAAAEASEAGAETITSPGVPKLELEPQQIDPRQKAGMARVDRENAIVMCQEMLRHGADELSAQRVSMWQGLIKEGTEAIVTERSAK
ncbi:GTP binding protein [Geosmithia morbida]|uniref:GTP binding protein n=1 Tax=Geosmithia morbida TaxID=1094350 RepID=A0A9P4YVZ2_9HYPO|nr:GTP binding protein [Geosmithia morbida]KAF4122784.1 GTP binding protein [Geosmithia morbida]